MKAFGSLFLLLALALFLASCSSGVSSSGDGISSASDRTMASADSQESGASPAVSAKVAPSSIGPDDSRLRVKLGDLSANSIPILNGGLVDFGNGLKAELFVDPYPTDTLTSWIDLYLTDGPLDEPVEDAHVQMEYDMWSMAHGPYVGFADNAINGHYVFRLDYIMFGAWEQVLEVRKAGSDETHRITLMIVAFP